MKTWKDATFKDVKTGKEFTMGFVSMEILERLKKGEVTIIKIEEHEYPEMLNLFEIEVLVANSKGEIIPPSLLKYLDNAKRKQKELIKYNDKYGIHI